MAKIQKNKWISGKEVLDKLQIQNFELLDLVKQGLLHPYRNGDLLPMPTVIQKFYILDQAKNRLLTYQKEYAALSAIEIKDCYDVEGIKKFNDWKKDVTAAPYDKKIKIYKPEKDVFDDNKHKLTRQINLDSKNNCFTEDKAIEHYKNMYQTVISVAKETVKKAEEEVVEIRKICKGNILSWIYFDKINDSDIKGLC
jgi:hypothetical protein